jgi:hypothetical protein
VGFVKTDDRTDPSARTASQPDGMNGCDLVTRGRTRRGPPRTSSAALPRRRSETPRRYEAERVRSCSARTARGRGGPSAR